MNSLGIQKTIIGIEQNKMDAVRTIKDACKNCRGISVEVMRTRYPQGSEKQLVQSLTGREVPDGGLPMDCQCVVLMWERQRLSIGRFTKECQWCSA